jgi:hypothetical protein
VNGWQHCGPHTTTHILNTRTHTCTRSTTRGTHTTPLGLGRNARLAKHRIPVSILFPRIKVFCSLGSIAAAQEDSVRKPRKPVRDTFNILTTLLGNLLPFFQPLSTMLPSSLRTMRLVGRTSTIRQTRSSACEISAEFLSPLNLRFIRVEPYTFNLAFVILSIDLSECRRNRGNPCSKI